MCIRDRITTTQQQQTVKQASELNKLSDALQRLPARIIDETNYNPIAALFSGEEATRSTPAPAPTTTTKPQLLPPAAYPPPPSPTLMVDPNRGLKTDIIKNHEFKLPSELDLSNTKKVLRLADDITDYNVERVASSPIMYLARELNNCEPISFSGTLTKELLKLLERHITSNKRIMY